MGGKLNHLINKKLIMGTLGFLIVFCISLGLITGAIFAYDEDVKGACALAAAFLIMIGLLLIPLTVPSKQREVVKELSKNEYALTSTPTGLMVSYKNGYSIFNDYYTAKNTTDTTKVMFVTKMSFYKTSKMYRIRIGDVEEVFIIK